MKFYLVLWFWFVATCMTIQAQTHTSYTAQDFIEPDILAQKIRQNKMDDILLIHIGFQNFIKGSANAGPATEQQGIEHLKELAQEVPKNQKIILYCGCCPIEVCPNIQPGYELLHEMGYTQIKILNLTSSIKADWLDKDYPEMEDKL